MGLKKRDRIRSLLILFQIYPLIIYYEKNVGKIYPELRFSAESLFNREYINVRAYEVHPDRDATVGWYIMNTKNGTI